MYSISASPSSVPGAAAQPELPAASDLPPDTFVRLSEFQQIADVTPDWLGESPESAPALGLLFSLANQRVSFDDLSALDDDIVNRFARLFDDHPLLGSCMLACLPKQIRDRPPGESVEALTERALSESSLRSLSRSLNRADVGTPGHARHGSAWGKYFTLWRDQIIGWAHAFRWAGSGHTCAAPGARTEVRAMQAYATAPSPRTLDMNFGRSGWTGYAIAMLYGSAIGHSLSGIPPIGPRSIRDMPIMPFVPAARIGSCASRAPNAAAACNNLDISTSDAFDVNGLSRAVQEIWQWLSLTTMDVTERSFNAFNTLEARMPRDPLRFTGALAAPLDPPELLVTTDPPAPADRLAEFSIATWRAPQPAASTQHRDLFSTSPGLDQLTIAANSWHTRGSEHRALHVKFDRLMRFSAPPTEAELFNATMSAEPDFASLDQPDIVLRRHKPVPGSTRFLDVTYWKLFDAARSIRAGLLDIVNPPEGVYFDVCRRTPHGAIQGNPTLVSAQRFRAVVTRWIEKCDTQAKQTWSIPEALPGQLYATTTVESQGALALSDLTLGYRQGLISYRALALAQDVISHPDAFHLVGSQPTSHRLVVKLTHGGREQTWVPAGTFVIFERPQSGLALLYLMGDAQAWRAFASPEQLTEAIEENAGGLRDMLLERLPQSVVGAGPADAPPVVLSPIGDDNPIRMANLATLDVMRADSLLIAEVDETTHRVRQYTNWLSGASASAVEEALETARRERVDAGLSASRHSAVISLTQIDSIRHIQTLRAQLSTAMPDVHRMAQDFARSVLARSGLSNTDPDTLYVRMEDSPAPIPLTDAMLYKMRVPDAVATGPLLRRSPEGTLRPETQDWTSHRQFPNAAAIVNELADGPPEKTIHDVLSQFWSTSRNTVRQVLKSEFIAQIWLQHSSGALSVDVRHLASRIAGPIDLNRFYETQLSHEIVSPKVKREWLLVKGHNSTLMAVTAEGHSSVLLIAAYPDGPRVHGFESRAKLEDWFERQTTDDGARRQLASGFSPPSLDDEWLVGAKLAPIGLAVPSEPDTFTVLTSAYEAQSPHGAWTPESASRHRTFLKMMDYLSKLDLAVGFASWAFPRTQPVGAAISMVDLSVGVVGEGVALLTGDRKLHSQAWQSMVSAVVAQGAVASRFPALAFITGSPRFNYYVSQAPVVGEELILGLHRTNGRLYAAIDSATRAYVEFDTTVGHFRLIPSGGSSAAASAATSDAPFMRLGSEGRWHVATSADLLQPALEEPTVAWRIDQNFLERYDVWRNQNDPLFENALRAYSDAALQRKSPIEATVSDLRLLKLQFIDRATRTPEALGTLAGRINELQNAVDAATTITLARLPAQAREFGALYVPITQRFRPYLSHLRTGLLRASAVASYYGRAEYVTDQFNAYAQLSPAASEVFAEDLAVLGMGEIPYLPGPRYPVTGAGIETLLEGAQDTTRLFEITAGTRTLLLGRRLPSADNPEYLFMDPAVGLVSHSNREEMTSLVNAHLRDVASEYGIPLEDTGHYAIDVAEIDARTLGDMPLFRDIDHYVTVRQAFRI
ncbi:dermonecrotic toxin domain-containing protein [Pandoraea sputorum]|uniref:dermonecrotic toxin domain-containing protein n=3 Tax=Pandoraea sputorum TaxID=93222 RepID=UPI002F3F2A7B